MKKSPKALLFRTDCSKRRLITAQRAKTAGNHNKIKMMRFDRNRKKLLALLFETWCNLEQIVGYFSDCFYIFLAFTDE